MKLVQRQHDVKSLLIRQGRVIGAEYSGGSGTVAGSASARKSCVASALRSKFSVDLNAKAEQTGTITYRFR